MISDPKTQTIRSAKHLKFIASLPCCTCLNPTADAHHEPLNGRGVGLKGSDLETVPLCRLCHIKRHYKGKKTFWRDALGNDWKFKLKKMIEDYQSKNDTQ